MSDGDAGATRVLVASGSAGPRALLNRRLECEALYLGCRRVETICGTQMLHQIRRLSGEEIYPLTGGGELDAAMSRLTPGARFWLTMEPGPRTRIGLADSQFALWIEA